MSTESIKVKLKDWKEDTRNINELNRRINKLKKIFFSFFKFLILLGISYIILGPVISMISHSFFTGADLYNPSVFLFPFKPTLENYRLSILRLDYWKTLGYTLVYIISLTGIQIFISSLTGYGFARFEFPFKKILFACVIVTIVLPTHTIMLPLYQHFRKFDLFGIITAVKGDTINLLSKETPMYLMTGLGNGLRTGLYIYIFNQFFRGLPKEIEEAAFIDGAGMFYTYFRIMLVNAIPSVITVAVFSLVWQYNDMFFSRLFAMPSNHILTFRLSTLQASIEFLDQVKDPMVAQLYLYAGIILVIIPILVIYLLLQRYFIEGVERSGIVG